MHYPDMRRILQRPIHITCIAALSPMLECFSPRPETQGFHPPFIPCHSGPVYQAQCPPSIRRSAPVMKLLASLSRKTAAPRYSSG